MPKLYPLRFKPLFRRYLWGGRRLGLFLGKQLDPGDNYAESWEVVDRGPDQSVVAFGPLAGISLHELVSVHRQELFGSNVKYASFPLLFKFLDAHANLSVQVHPNDEHAARLDPPDRGKTEAWLILHAEPGSLVYAGLKRGFDRAALEREVHRGTTELCLHRIMPSAGDCIFLPAGVLHALGSGLVVAEIQQNSDTTFRLFDWNRVGPDGFPRKLHVAQALDAIDYDAGPIEVQSPQPTGRPGVERLVACDKFTWHRWTFRGVEHAGEDGQFHLLAVIEGSVAIAGDPHALPLTKGQTMLVPACCGTFTMESPRGCVLLDATVGLEG